MELQPEELRLSATHGGWFRDVLWRLGPWCPPVTLPEDHVVVTEDVARQLRPLGVGLERVRMLAVTEAGNDWRTWGERWYEEARAIRERVGHDGWDEVFVPYFDLGRSRAALSADDFRAVKRPVVVTEQPDLWELTAAVTFEQVRLDGKGTGMVRGVA